MKSKNLLFCLVALIVAFTNSTTATTYYCSNCSDCENKINSASAGDIVKLTADITNQSGTCINWKNSNVEFDCQGHLIGGNYSGSGSAIHIGEKSNNIIKNCKIAKFIMGIDLDNSSNLVITNNTVGLNVFGISLQYLSFNNTITNNTLILNGWGGVYIAYSPHNKIAGNIFINDGLSTDGSYSSIVNNTVNGEPLVYLENVSNSIVTDAGQVILIGSNNITVRGLILSNTSIGLTLMGTDNSVISDNIINQNNQYGIYFGDSVNNTIENNTIGSNDEGIALANSDNNMITNNTVSSNNNGIGILNSFSNKIINNTVNLNHEIGINILTSDSNAIISNHVCFNNNSDFFIYSSSGNQGDRNTCNKPKGWNDQGATGCTYSCTLAECPVRGDKSPCDGKIDDFEL